MIFKDRIDSATRLAEKLDWLKKENPIVLAIPRGGVVTGDVLARLLSAELDIIVSRKIGAPNNSELAIGSVAHDGTFFPNSSLISTLKVPMDYIESKKNSEVKEIKRRLAIFRGNKDYELNGKTVVLVDDGIATGATMISAINWVKKQKPRRIIVAVPVAPKEIVEKIDTLDEVYVLNRPTFFNSVGEFYDSFEQVEDNQVIEIMKRNGFLRKD